MDPWQKHALTCSKNSRCCEQSLKWVDMMHLFHCAASLQGGCCVVAEENPFSLERQQCWSKGAEFASIKLWPRLSTCIVEVIVLIPWRERTKSVHRFVINSWTCVASRFLINTNNTHCWSIFDGSVLFIFTYQTQFCSVVQKELQFPCANLRWRTEVGKQHTTDSFCYIWPWAFCKLWVKSIFNMHVFLCFLYPWNRASKPIPCTESNKCFHPLQSGMEF